MKIKSERLRWIDKKVRGKKILDIGFVANENINPDAHIIIRKNNPESLVVGLDTNEKKVKEYGFPDSVVAAAEKIPFENGYFSDVVMGEVIEHVIEPYPILKEIARVLETGGNFYLTTPNPYSPAGWLKHWLFSRKPYGRKNYRDFLGYIDHKIFWEPLSLCNILNTLGLEVSEITTTNPDVPYLSGFINFSTIDIWPLNRFGSYYCLIAKKKCVAKGRQID